MQRCGSDNADLRQASSGCGGGHGKHLNSRRHSRTLCCTAYSSGLWRVADGIALQLGTGYTVAFLVYQIGTLITTGALGTGFLPGMIAVASMAAIVVYLIKREEKTFDREYGVKAWQI